MGTGDRLMVAKMEVTNPTDARTATVRIYSSLNKFEEVDAAVERVKLTGRARNDGVAIAAQLTSELQARLDFWQLLKDLPLDDPDRTINPARGDLFWQDIDGDRYLVGREGIVTITWTGTRYSLEWQQA